MKQIFNANLVKVLRLALFLMIPLLLSNCTQNSNPTSGSSGDLSNPAIKPLVIFTLPGNNAVGPFDIYTPSSGSNKPSFVVQFNKLMNLNSFTTNTATCSGFDRPVVVALHRVYYPYPFQVDKQIKSSKPISSEKTASKSSRVDKQTSYDYDDVMEFDIRDSIAYSQMRYGIGKTYTVAFDTSLKDINGNSLQPYTFSFTPEPYFRVTATYPANGQKNV